MRWLFLAVLVLWSGSPAVAASFAVGGPGAKAVFSSTLSLRAADRFSGAVVRVQAQDDKALATAIQLELNRLGCSAGTPDGLWGPGSKRALASYAEKIGATDLGSEPSEALLTQLRAENGQLCTLPPGIVAGDDRAATAHLEAVKYSYKIWGSLPSRVATQATEYGVLRCEAGSGSTPRLCTWQ